MGQEFGRNLEAGFPPGEDRLAELQRVPVDDDRGQQVEAGDPVVLSLSGSVSQFSALVEVDGALEGMVRLALVQADLGAPAHVGVRGPVDNLGVSAWVTVQCGDDVDNSAVYSWSEQLGYNRIGRKWGLTLRRIEGYEGKLESIEEEKWPFNDAPRSLRIMAVPKIPELIKKLDGEAREMVEQVSASINSAAPLVEAIEISALPQRSIKKKLGGRS